MPSPTRRPRRLARGVSLAATLAIAPVLVGAIPAAHADPGSDDAARGCARVYYQDPNGGNISGDPVGTVRSSSSQFVVEDENGNRVPVAPGFGTDLSTSPFSLDSNGGVAYLKLPRGKLKLVQLSARDGFVSNPTPVAFDTSSVRDGECYNGVVIKNQPKPTGAVNLNVVNRTAPALGVPSAQLGLWDATTGKWYASLAPTGADGSAKLDRIAPGDYVIAPIGAPAGYSPTANQTIRVTAGQTTVTTLMAALKDGESGLLINLSDATNTGTKVAGAKYAVWRVSDGKWIKDLTLTDSNGQVFTTLPTDTYMVQQVAAAPGYKLNSQQFTINLSGGQVTSIGNQANPN